LGKLSKDSGRSCDAAAGGAVIRPAQTSGRWRRAYVGIGANLGARLRNCATALRLLSSHPSIEVLRCSGLYETEPVGVQTANWFLNAVAEISTDLGPRDLLRALLETERTLGRDRSAGPDRIVDLDLLYFDDTVLCEDGLEVPHPRLGNRRFVLAPWAELAPDLSIHPLGKTVAQLLAEIHEPGPAVRRLTGPRASLETR